MIIENHTIKTETTDKFQAKFIESPNFYSTLSPKKLIIHYTEGPHAQSAIDTFKKEGNPSAHLIISRDGKEVIQMVPFNKRAKHMAFSNNNVDTIGIELDYPGCLSPKPHAYKYMHDYPANKRIIGYINRDERVWPIYPIDQLECLFQICKKLIEEFPEINEIKAHADLEDKTDPGPAFPMTYFREKLLGNKINGRVLHETSQAAQLRTSPKEDYQIIPGGVVAKNRAVAIIDDQDTEFALVEVMEPENGNKWLVGWVPKTHLQVRKYQIVIKNHMLFGQDENQYLRQFEFKPAHKNNYGSEISPESDIQYLIMHYTAVTSMSSTIHQFVEAQSNPDQRVSAHLLIGRDGRVVQFVPFNYMAYHCGYSFWEELEGINHYSIGIEMVNAGPLESSDDGYKKSGKEIIPEDQIGEAAHWMYPDKIKSWQKYTPIQLEIAKDIAKALKEKYSLKDILGHDQINLNAKSDPGPLFPIEEWRKDLFGRRQPDVQRWRIIQENSTIFVNQNYDPPHPEHPKHPIRLKKNTNFTFAHQIGSWLLVKAEGKWGWIGTNDGKVAKSSNKTGKITNNNVVFYNRWYGSDKIVPPIEHQISPLQPGKEVRIQIFKDDWAFIANIPGTSFFEGWVKKECLEKFCGENTLKTDPIEMDTKKPKRQKEVTHYPK